MKRLLLSVGAAAASLVVASVAFAQTPGVNINWGACYGDGPVTSNKASACASNSGNNSLVVSYVSPSDVAQMSGNEAVIDLISQTASLPSWWQMLTTPESGCRTGAITSNAIYGGPATGCTDFWAGAAAGGIAAVHQNPPPGGWSISPGDTAAHARIIIAFAVPASGIGPITHGVEYFSCNVVITNAKSVNSACTGCSTPVCLVLNSVKVTTPTPLAGTDVTISGATTAGSNEITWQGAGANCASVPVRNVTWGAVKALYR